MAQSLRSTKGCWTCRLRRKKCDEKHPVCDLCDTLAIPCYGYGPKPDWMDGGEIEKTQIENLKQTVRYTSRQRGLRDKPKSQQLHSKGQTHEPSANFTQATSYNDPTDVLYAEITQGEERMLSDTSSSFHILSQTELRNGAQTQNPLLSSSNTMLLMHFVDNVYPFELPISKSRFCSLQSDRNWLLPLIMHIKPLYHAVLGLSAFHQRGLNSHRPTDQSQKICLRKYSQKHLSLCLRHLQLEIQLLGAFAQRAVVCPRRGVGVLTSIVQLVLLEMCIGETDNWQVHLNAATSMVEGIYKSRKLHPESEVISQIDNQTLSDLGWEEFSGEFYTENPLIQHQFALDALIAMILNLDILSCVTVGRPPQLPRILGDLSESLEHMDLQIKLEHEHWVIILIGKIAALQGPEPDHANGSRQEYHDSIKSTINYWIEGNIQFIEQLQCSEGCTFSAATSIRVTTYLYTLAAIIYLQLTTTGAYADSEEIRTCVSSFMKAFCLTRHMCTPQNLLWPVYITGSVASENERFLFRNVLSDPLLNFSIGPRARALEKLEDIWKRKGVNGDLPGSPIFCSDLQCSNLLLL